MPHINDLIYAAFDRVAGLFLDQLPSRSRLHAITLDYSIYTNCMDSSLAFDDERIQEQYEAWRKL